MDPNLFALKRLGLKSLQNFGKKIQERFLNAFLQKKKRKSHQARLRMMEQKHTWFNPTQAKGINKINIGTIYRGKHWPN